MEYISFEKVMLFHDRIIESTGGGHGIRDFGLLHSAVERLKATFSGQDLYPSIFEKAAALVHSLILNHPFVDGNKRTAIASMAYFLYLNRINLKITNKEVVNLGMDIEKKKIDMEKIVLWLKKKIVK